MIIVDQIESRFKIFTRPQHMHWMTTLNQCLLGIRQLKLANNHVNFCPSIQKTYFLLMLSPLDCINIIPGPPDGPHFLLSYSRKFSRKKLMEKLLSDMQSICSLHRKYIVIDLIIIEQTSCMVMVALYNLNS